MRSIFFGQKIFQRKFIALKVALIAVTFILSAGDVFAVPAGSGCTGQGMNPGRCAYNAGCPGVNYGQGDCDNGLICCGVSATPGFPAPNPTPVGFPPPNSQDTPFTNPLKFNTVEEVLGSLLGTLRGIIVVLSIVFIVIGAIFYITSAGDEGRMKTAKGAITASMIGLALGIAAPSFLKEIGEILGWGAVNNTEVSGAKTLTEIATNVLNFLLSIVGILGIIMLVVGGIMYLTAAGDENRIDIAKRIVWYSIIGIITALAALVIVTQIASFFA